MTDELERSRMVKVQLKVAGAPHLAFPATRPHNLHDSNAVMARQRFFPPADGFREFDTRAVHVSVACARSDMLPFSHGRHSCLSCS